jgi:hypothetical protein
MSPLKQKTLILSFLLFMAGPLIARAAMEFYFVDLTGQGYTSASLIGSPVAIYVGSTS